MIDQPSPTPGEPFAPVNASLSDAPRPAATFSGRTTTHRTAAIRAGMLLGTGLLVAIGAAVAMGASPSPSASSGGTPHAVPGQGGPGAGGPGDRFGPFGGIGPFGPSGPGGPARPFAGLGPMAGRGFGSVKVTAVAGSSVSLATDDGWTRTITVTTSTTITRGGAAATIADLAVGDTVRLAETRNADGTYTITAIAIVLPQVAGTVTAVGTDTITVTVRDGTSQTIRTNGSTVYHLDQGDGKRTDVTVGASIVATGTKAADGSLAATSVWVRLPRVTGTVSAVTASTITLSRRDGTTVTIHIGSGTTIQVAGIANAKLSDVTKGMVIVVEGSQRADGSIDAQVIAAGTFGKAPGHDRQPGAGPNATQAPSASGGTTG